MATERLRKVHIVEAHVMGRSAVLTTATLMVPVALVQASTQDSSRLLADFGGMALSMVWSACLLFACALLWTSRLLAHPDISVPIELAGTALLALSLLSYPISLLLETGWTGALFAVMLCCASSINVLGRGFLVWRAWKVAKELR